MPEFSFSEIFPLGPDTTEYRLIGTDGVSEVTTPLGTFLKVEPEAITLLTETAMRDIAHLLRTDHLKQLKKILDELCFKKYNKKGICRYSFKWKILIGF